MTGWEQKKLGDLIHVKHGFAFKGEHFSPEGEKLVLKPGNFPIGGGIRLRPGKDDFYTGSYPPEFELSPGDLLVVMTDLTQAAPILGSPAFVPEQPVMLHNQRLGLVTIKPGAKLDQRFLYYLLLSDASRSQVRATASGATVRHTAPERIYRVSVAVPDLKVQEMIGEILGSLDDLIENNRRRVEMLEKMARAIYREWFVRFRFPGHEKVKTTDSPLGAIPAGWNPEGLAKIAKVNAAARTPSPEEVIRYLDISALGERDISTLASIPGAEAPGRARRVVRPGDVVWSMVRPNRRAHALLVSPGHDWIASTGLAVLTPTGVPSSYLFETVSATEFSDYLVSRESGAAYPAVKPKDFEGAVILLPDPQTLSEFDAAVSPMHRMAWVLREESASLAEVRDLLLPKLMTGQVDVSAFDLDALVEGAVA